MTPETWMEFKEKRARERDRDEKIKALIRDFVGALEILALMVAAWFFLAVLYV